MDHVVPDEGRPVLSSGLLKGSWCLRRRDTPQSWFSDFTFLIARGEEGNCPVAHWGEQRVYRAARTACCVWLLDSHVWTPGIEVHLKWGNR